MPRCTLWDTRPLLSRGLSKHLPSINSIRIFSDASSAIKKIFDGSPHPSQAASILFRTCFHNIFTSHKDISASVVWTPGHKGTQGMKTVDRLAKKGADSNKEPLISFTSRSAALSNLEVKALKRWKHHIEDNPFSENSGSYEASLYLHPHLRPPKWWKKINRPIMSRLTQFASGHRYTGEYFKRFNVPHPTNCPCSLSGLYPPVLHSRSHILCACPLFKAS